MSSGQEVPINNNTTVSNDDYAKPKNNIKPVLNICAMCCKGPKTTFDKCEDVMSNYHLDSELLKCSNCNQGFFCSHSCQK